jgi:ABC-2 type transport system permease protein
METDDNQRMKYNQEALHRAVASGPPPARPSRAAASLVFAWRALLKIKYVPEQLFDVTLFPIMFLLMYTYLFGGAIAGSTRDYLQFLLPGILVMTVVMITMYTGLELNNDIAKGIFDRFRSLPIWRPAVLVGALLVDTVRYSMATAIMILLGLILGFRPAGGALGTLWAVLLLLVFSFCMSWIWTALGIVMRTEKSLTAMSMMILFPLTFISNVFVDPQTLPMFLQHFVKVNPISLLVTAVRGLMHGHAQAADIGWVLLASVLMVLIFGPITMHLYRRKE